MNSELTLALNEAQQPDYAAKSQTQQKHRRDRHIEAKTGPLNPNIAWQPTNPAKAAKPIAGKPENNSHNRDQ